MRWSSLLLVAALGALPACWSSVTGAQGPAVSASLKTAIATKDALAIADALEELIAAGKDTPEDRQLAYAEVRAIPIDTPAYTYARAVVTGRLVQLKGLLGADMVGEVEHYASRSRELDPDFRRGAATRMLGTLYVVAPAALLRKGDSETGLELLEGLVEKDPDVIENHLRVAEAYIALGDAEPAKPHLCRCSAERGKLRRDDQALLAQLLKDAGNPTCPKPAAQAPTP
ncbi:tetratricopeptide repeat protein [Polyangium spumosum]|uniref:Tetratricopeptide repeat protein n=1 Tax=Polyangium spumosum TaxID=889282 RepID=A0A6N7Q412_9BACT|nr:hypothetical protein [Polyangium spumosum]MRG97044.1 hypothetical protein [Polyangium spumosum]